MYIYNDINTKNIKNKTWLYSDRMKNLIPTVLVKK